MIIIIIIIGTINTSDQQFLDCGQHGLARGSMRLLFSVHYKLQVKKDSIVSFYSKKSVNVE